MDKIRGYIKYFSKAEIIIWLSSMTLIAGSFAIFGGENYLTLSASVIGCTSLIFCAKGNPFGQALMIVFSLLYGMISFTCAYYGEMITYLGMTAPMAVFSLASWLKNPFNGNRAEVAVGRVSRGEAFAMILLSAAVTLAFYYILTAFNTANIVPSTFSVTTSFIAAYLTFRRSAFFALAYAVNDGVLIILWIMAAAENVMYLSVVSCFIAFLANDIYGYVSWRRMWKRQNGQPDEPLCPSAAGLAPGGQGRPCAAPEDAYRH